MGQTNDKLDYLVDCGYNKECVVASAMWSLRNFAMDLISFVFLVGGGSTLVGVLLVIDICLHGGQQ